MSRKEAQGYLRSSSGLSRCTRAMMAEKYTKKRDVTCKVVVLPIQTYCFFAVFVAVAVVVA